MDLESTADASAQALETALERLCRQLLQRWREFPAPELASLREFLTRQLLAAIQSEPETITVMNPVSRPARLRLHSVVSDVELDSFYHREWAELAVSHEGICYLVYRRKDGGDYAVEWSTATSVPTSMLGVLPPELTKAMFESDDG